MRINCGGQKITIFFVISTVVAGCAMQVKPEARHVKVITQDQAAKCEFIKVINTYDVAFKYSGDSEAEGAQNMAKNRVAEAGGNAMRILSIANQEVKDKNKTYVTVEAFKCPTGATNASGIPDSNQDSKIDKSTSRKSNSETPAAPAQISLKEAQQQLAALGYNPGPADGQAGSRTAAALKRFQSDNGLPTSGHLDAETAVLLSQRASQGASSKSSRTIPPTQPSPSTQPRESQPARERKAATDL